MTINEHNQVLITREELLIVGITEKSIHHAVDRNSIIAVERGVYLYNSLRSDWQKLVENTLCCGKDAYSYVLEKQRNEVLRGLLPTVKEADKAFVLSYNIEKVCTQTGVVIPTTHLPKATQDEYLLKCRWLALLEMLDDIIGKKAEREAFNRTYKTKFDSKISFRAAVLSLCNEKGKKLLPNNLRKLNDLLQAYKEVGAKAVISAKFGKANAQKLGDEQTEYLIWLLSQQSVTSYTHATTIYNRIAGERGWAKVDEKTVYNRMITPEYHSQWYLAKHGWYEWKKIYELSLQTVPASFKNALWVYDDTKHNLHYRQVLKVAGKEQVATLAKLNVACIIDAYSGKILSRVFFEGKPTVNTVQECMREALANSGGELPYQILYDGDSAPVNYFKRFDGVHFKAMPYNGQSKPIERRFGEIQQNFYRLFKHHTGQNVTAKATKSKVNKELLADMEKAGELPTKDKAIEQGKLIFHLANCYQAEGKVSPNEKYEKGTYPQGYTPRKLSAIDNISLLWQEHESTKLLPYTNEGIEIQVQKTKYQYVGLDKDNLPDQQLIGQSFKVFYNPEQLQKAVALYTDTPPPKE